MLSYKFITFVVGDDSEGGKWLQSHPLQQGAKKNGYLIRDNHLFIKVKLFSLLAEQLINIIKREKFHKAETWVDINVV